MAPKQRANSKPKASSSKESPRDSENEGPEETPIITSPSRRARKGGVSWTPVFKRIGIFVLIILIPSLLNYAVLNQEGRMLVPANSTRYDIGWSQNMLLRCTGTGLPTVVLEAPIGQSSDAWALVEPLIARRTRVCVYDRAGLGFSDRAYRNTSLYSNDFSKAALDRDRTQPSTVERMVDDLHRLLSYSSNQPKPLLLVSMDFTSFISRFYTQLYEHEIAGLFLIDPAYEMIFDALDKENEHESKETTESGSESITWQAYWYKKVVVHAQGVWLSAIIGFNRLSLMIGLMSPVEEPALVNILSKEVVTRKKYLLCQPKHLSSVFNEYFFMNESLQQIKTVFKVKPFPEHLPVTIATYKNLEEGALGPELTEVWTAGQKQLLSNVHPNSKNIVLPGSDYLSLYKHPRAVASAVSAMVEQWRRESKLAA